MYSSYINNKKAELTRRFCIFASYSETDRIMPEVVFLLKALRSICNAIIFISDNLVNENELDKIKELVVHTDCQHHGKYDFGSYSKGLKWFKNSKYYDETDELLFCNDSVLGPYKSLQCFLDKKSAMGNPDFLGCTINYLAHTEIYPHVQSYFFTVSRNIFSEDYFSDFFQSVKHETDKTDIVMKYEIGLTKLLEKHNIKPQAVFSKQLISDPCREFIEHFDDMFFVKKNRFKYYHTYKLNMLLKKTDF